MAPASDLYSILLDGPLQGYAGQGDPSLSLHGWQRRGPETPRMVPGNLAILPVSLWSRPAFGYMAGAQTGEPAAGRGSCRAVSQTERTVGRLYPEYRHHRRNSCFDKPSFYLY